MPGDDAKIGYTVWRLREAEILDLNLRDSEIGGRAQPAAGELHLCQIVIDSVPG